MHWACRAEVSRVCTTFPAVATASKDPVTDWILGEGGATKVLGTSSVGGGCINVAYKYNTDAGPFFVKSNR